MYTETIQKDKLITLLCAFILPMLFVLPAFAAVGIYPFGEKSLLIIDMYNEYIDYLAQMNETIHTSGSFLRSWNMGLGLNMLGLIAFYTSSPFNLIILALPLSCITEAVFAVTLLKLGLAGLLFAIFARESFPEAGRVFHMIFAVAYALSAYNIAYSSNIMWLDGSAFLPLVLLGVERILNYGRYRLFLFSLIYVFFTSYYIGYMIGVFAFLYLTARYFAKRNDMRAYYARILPRFLGSAALAAGCCAFLLLPAFLNLKNGQSDMWQIPFEPKLRYPVTLLASKLLPGVYDSLTDSGLPNIYCTVFGVAMCLLYFFTKAVPTREKLVYGGLLGILVLSFSCEFADLAWHAFEDPTWFPARYSFIFSFWVLYLALRCSALLDKISRRELIFAASTQFFLFVEIAVSRFWFMELRKATAGILLLCLYALVLALWPSKNRHSLSAILVFFVCMEIFYNASYMMLGMDMQFGYENRAEYRDFMQSYGAAAERLKTVDSGVYRTEILEQRSANGAMALGYNSISHYSTTTDQALNAFLRDLGYNTGTVNELRFAASTPLTNGLLGIKYVLSPKPLGKAYKLKEAVGDIGIYENTAAFPLAFWVPDSAVSFTPYAGNGPFELQNDFLSSLMGRDIRPFTEFDHGKASLDNTEQIHNGDHIEYVRQARNKDCVIKFQAANPDKRELFAYFPIYRKYFSGSDIFVNGESKGYDFTYRANTIIPLGSGDNSVLEIMPGGERLKISAEYFAALDLESAVSAAQEASEHRLELSVFLDTKVEGRISAPDNGYIATTFPYDEGWTIKVDGKKIRPVHLAGVFLAIPVTAGVHDISMSYLPSGFIYGVVISLASIAGIVLFHMIKRRKPDGKDKRAG